MRQEEGLTLTTSSLMSTTWLGSVDTLISMMRSPLYAISKCTAAVNTPLSCHADQALTVMPLEIVTQNQ